MKLAFCLFNYFPYGGLQRDFLRILRTCRARGHEIHVYTMQWEGEQEPNIHLHLIKVQQWQNHTRSQAFAQQIKERIAQEQYDVVIGFNKMPGLDIYYTADVCYQSRIANNKNFIYQFLPRYRAWRELEAAVFSQGLPTKILLLAAKQQQEYHAFYQTEAERFHLLPPGIAKDRKAPANAQERRENLRAQYHLKTDDFLLLMIGSGFRTKGVDRAIHGLSALAPAIKSRCHLFVIGKDEPTSFVKLAKRTGVQKQTHFLGAREDILDFLLAADLLLHPAYHENTGTVLLEALVAGLPVLTLDHCGYAHYITDTNAGKVLTAPYTQAAWNHALEEMLLSQDHAIWRQNALDFAKAADIYSLPEKAADFIEQVGQNRAALS